MGSTRKRERPPRIQFTGPAIGGGEQMERPNELIGLLIHESRRLTDISMRMSALANALLLLTGIESEQARESEWRDKVKEAKLLLQLVDRWGRRG